MNEAKPKANDALSESQKARRLRKKRRAEGVAARKAANRRREHDLAVARRWGSFS